VTKPISSNSRAQAKYNREYRAKVAENRAATEPEVDPDAELTPSELQARRANRAASSRFSTGWTTSDEQAAQATGRHLYP
jgi:hypothetical protein